MTQQWEDGVDGDDSEIATAKENGTVVDNKPPGNIMHAAYVGAFDVVKSMVEDGTPPDNPDSLQGSTPLHWASFGGHLNIVRWLVKKARADPNRPNNDGCTPLLFACEMGHTGVAQWLVREGGAQVNARDFISWQTPLHRVVSNSQRKSTATREEEDLILWLVEAGADLGAMDRFGKRVEDITGDQAPLEIGAKGNGNNTAFYHQVNSEGDVASSNDSKQAELVEMIVAVRENEDGAARERVKRRSCALRKSTAEATVQLSPKLEAKQRIPLSRKAKEGTDRAPSRSRRQSSNPAGRTSGTGNNGDISGSHGAVDLQSSPRSSSSRGGGSDGSGGGVAAPPDGVGGRVGGGPPAPVAAEEDFRGEGSEGGSRFMEEMVALFGGGKASNSRAIHKQESGPVDHEQERQRRLSSKGDDEKRDLQSIKVAEEVLHKAGLEMSVAKVAIPAENQVGQDEALVVENIRELAQKKALGLITEEEFTAKKREVLEMEQLRRDAAEETRKREQGEVQDIESGILTSVGQNTPPPSPKESVENGDEKEARSPLLSVSTAKDLRKTYKASDLDKYSTIKSSEPRVFGPVPDRVKESLAARDSMSKRQDIETKDSALGADTINDQIPKIEREESPASVRTSRMKDTGSVVDVTIAGRTDADRDQGNRDPRSDRGMRYDAIHGRSCCTTM